MNSVGDPTPFFTCSRLRLPLEKYQLRLPLKRPGSRLLGAVYRGFYRLWLPLNWLNGSGSLKSLFAGYGSIFSKKALLPAPALQHLVWHSMGSWSHIQITIEWMVNNISCVNVTCYWTLDTYFNSTKKSAVMQGVKNFFFVSLFLY